MIPPSAQAKLATIQGQAADANEAMLSATRRISDLDKSLATVSDPKELAAIEQEVARLRSVRAQQSSRHAELANLAAQIRGWLQALPVGTSFKEVKATATLRKDETLPRALQRIRAEITMAQAELGRVKTAPPPKDELKSQIADRVRQLAERGKPLVTVNAGNFKLAFNDPTAFAGASPDRAASVLAWLDPDKFEQRLREQIDALPEPHMALTAKEKRERTTALTEQIDELERQEEALIERMLGDGIDVTRRANASPPAVLGVKRKAA